LPGASPALDRLLPPDRIANIFVMLGVDEALRPASLSETLNGVGPSVVCFAMTQFRPSINHLFTLLSKADRRAARQSRFFPCCCSDSPIYTDAGPHRVPSRRGGAGTHDPGQGSERDDRQRR